MLPGKCLRKYKRNAARLSFCGIPFFTYAPGARGRYSVERQNSRRCPFTDERAERQFW